MSVRPVVCVISRNMETRTRKYERLADRLASFRNWPKQIHQTPESLAEAGLFYEGNYDQVRCYVCDGELDHWEPGDQPWTEHARHFPNCGLVQRTRTEEQWDDIENDLLSTDPTMQLTDTEMTLREWNFSEPIVKQVMQIVKSDCTKRHTVVDCYKLAENLQLDEQKATHRKMYQETLQIQADSNVACLTNSVKPDDQKRIICPNCNGQITIADSKPSTRTAGVCLCHQHPKGETLSVASCDSEENVVAPNVLDSAAAQSVLENGEDPEKVKEAINRLNESKGVGPHSGKDIMRVILDMEENEELGWDYQPAASARPTQHTSMACSRCLGALANTVCIPCDHMAVCRTCSSNLQLCPVCYEVITGLKFTAK